ncbi:hypothetical protein Tco_1423904, partial [Tanacetum coccineum]
IRLEKLGASARNHQELVTKSTLSSDQGNEYSALATELSSGINRKLMTKLVPSSSTTTNNKNYKNDPRLDRKLTHGHLGKEELFHTTSVSGNSKDKRTEIVSERYPDVVDITEMDYSRPKKKPPIHN